MTREATRTVDLAHADAARSADPAGFMRGRQADAERAWARFGRRRDLALVLAYAASLDRS